MTAILAGDPDAFRVLVERESTKRAGVLERLDETFDSAAPTSTTDPLALALDAERADAVRSAVALLDEPYREVVALRFFSELSLNEIAATTGHPLGTVKTHLHRGLERLRRAIGAEGGA